MPALRFVAAQIMKMPIRHANAAHIPWAPDGDHIAAGVFKAKFVPAFRRLRKHRVGLPAAVPTLRMYALENAAGLDHIKEIGISLHKRRKHLLERGKIIDAVQRYLRERKRRSAFPVAEGRPPFLLTYSMAILLEEVSFFGSSFGISTVSTPDSYLAFTSSGFTSPT